MALYARVHDAMAGPADAPPAAPPLQRQHFAADLDRTVLAYAGPEYVVYAVFRCVPAPCMLPQHTLIQTLFLSPTPVLSSHHSYPQTQPSLGAEPWP